MKGRQPYGPGLGLIGYSLESMIMGARRANGAWQDAQLESPVGEEELAGFIRDVVNRRFRYDYSRHLLEAIADALDGKDGLYLKVHRRRGQTFLQREERLSRDNEIAALVWRDLNDCGSMEAAVTGACEQFDISRQTVFDALKNLAQFYRSEIQRNQVPEQERKIGDEAIGGQYSQYLSWLDRYLDETPADEG